jgi:hypothetical protein
MFLNSQKLLQRFNGDAQHLFSYHQKFENLEVGNHRNYNLLYAKFMQLVFNVRKKYVKK